MDLRSADLSLIGEGWVVHSRPLQAGRPGRLLKNSFRYPIFNILVPVHNVQDVNQLRSGRFISLATEDYLEGKSGSLQENIRDFLASHLNYSCDSIWLQTLPKIFGYSFNPVSFWYCYRNNKLHSVLCEVNNTFKQRHFYFVRDIDSESPGEHRSLKEFHVSPFFSMDGHYKFKFSQKGNQGTASIRLFHGEDLKLDTKIALNFTTLKDRNSLSLFWKYGFMTVFVVVRIHLQALKLWFKGAEFFHLPKNRKGNMTYDIQDNGK